MSVITKLTFNQISAATLSMIGEVAQNAIECENGVSDTVYRVQTQDKSFILKLFENATFEEAKAEKELLEKLSSLPVLQHACDIFELENKPCALYEATKGAHPAEISVLHIRQIGEFLRSMHTATRNLTSKNPSFAKLCASKKAAASSTPFEPYAYLFDEMALLSVEGVIHGDIFPDNLFFEGEKLSGVIDFIEAFEGSFCFELGVVAFSFCKDKDELEHSKLSALAASYENVYDESSIALAASYAALFYGVGRFWRRGDYSECLSFLNNSIKTQL